MDSGSAGVAQAYPWSAERPLRLAIVDERSIWVEGLRHVMEDEDVDIVFTEATGAAMVERLAEGEVPDLIIMDVDLPREGRDSGVRAVRALRERGDAVPILIMSMAIHTALPLMREDTEGIGYLVKSGGLGVQGLLDAMARMVRRETVIDDRLVRELLARPATVRPRWA